MNEFESISESRRVELVRILLFIVTEKEEVTMKSFRVYNEERLAENVTHLIYFITNKEIYF